MPIYYKIDDFFRIFIISTRHAPVFYALAITILKKIPRLYCLAKA